MFVSGRVDSVEIWFKASEIIQARSTHMWSAGVAGMGLEAQLTRFQNTAWRLESVLEGPARSDSRKTACCDLQKVSFCLTVLRVSKQTPLNKRLSFDTLILLFHEPRAFNKLHAAINTDVF